MAITVTTIRQGVDSAVFDVIASADADAAATIAHGLTALPSVPTEVYLLPRLANFWTKQWWVTALDGVNVTCAMGVAVGGGNAAAQVRVIVRRPHTLGS